MRVRLPTHPVARGGLAMVGSALCFAAMGAGVKAASATLPTAVVVFWRNLISLALLTAWLLPRGPATLVTHRLGEHLIRAAAGLGAMSLFFYGIAHLRLADAVLLNYTLPLWLPLIERLWLGAPVPRGLGLPLAVGFAGLLLILKPGTTLFHGAALVVVVAAVLGALAQVGVRNLTRTEPVERIVFYFALLATGLSAVPLPWLWVTPDAAAWFGLLAAGVAGTAGQILLTRAYASAPAALVGPFLYTSVVFSATFDWFLWRQAPDALSVAGAGLVVAAAVLTLRLGKDKARTPAPRAPGP